MSIIHLNEIPTFAELNAADYTCSICLEGFQDGEEAFAHDGQGEPHIFHLGCINFWMGTNPSCPLCRFVVTHVNGESLEERRAAAEQQRLEQATATGARTLLLQELTTAALNGELDQVVQLLDQRDYTPDERGRAVGCAAAWGHLAVVQAILERGEIPEERYTAATRSAIVTARLDVFRYLQPQGVTDEVRIAGFWSGVAFGALRVVEAYLREGEIPQKDRGEAIVSASRAGVVDIVRVLVGNGAITSEHRDKALREARNNPTANSDAIIQLLEEATIDDDVL